MPSPGVAHTVPSPPAPHHCPGAPWHAWGWGCASAEPSWLSCRDAGSRFSWRHAHEHLWGLSTLSPGQTTCCGHLCLPPSRGMAAPAARGWAPTGCSSRSRDPVPPWKNPNHHQEPPRVPSGCPQHPSSWLAALVRPRQLLSPRTASTLPLFRAAPALLPRSFVLQPASGRIFLACFSLTATSCALMALLMLTVCKREAGGGGEHVRWEGLGPPRPPETPRLCRHLSVAGSHPGPWPWLVPAGCCPLPDAFLGCGWHPPGSAAARIHLLGIITMQLKQQPQRTLSCPRGRGTGRGKANPSPALGSGAAAAGSCSTFWGC